MPVHKLDSILTKFQVGEEERKAKIEERKQEIMKKEEKQV